MKETTKNIEYLCSKEGNKLIMRILKHIGKLENFQTENKNDENGPSVKIQMYEFFFSSVLIKAMQVPFLEHAFMLGFFENTIKRRNNADTGKNKGKLKLIKQKDHDDMRRERTMKLRQFYEFFSLLFDQKLFTPFSQFLSEKSHRELEEILKNSIKVKDGKIERTESAIGKQTFALHKYAIRTCFGIRNILFTGVNFWF